MEEMLKLRVLATASMGGGKELQKEMTSLKDEMFPFLAAEVQKTDLLERMKKELSRGPIKFRPVSSLQEARKLQSVKVRERAEVELEKNRKEFRSGVALG